MAMPQHIEEQRKALVEKIVKDIREGKPFFWDSGHYGKRPRNLLQSTKGKDRMYRGINSMQLAAVAQEKGFKDSRWATFAQAQAAGGHVKKGEKGTHIEFWQYTQDVMETNPATGKKEPVYEESPDGGWRKKQAPLAHPIIRSYVVFNAEQMEGIPPEHEITIEESERNEYMENMLKNSEAKICFDQSNRNFYRPSTDEIHVMPREEFKSMGEFYATCSHEIAHSTGAKERLNRPGITGPADGFGSEEYAKEELRAEMASMFLRQEYGLSFDQSHYENHAAYLQSWAKVLEDDPHELFRAAADAERAADYIKENMIEKGLQKWQDRQEPLSLKEQPKEKPPREKAQKRQFAKKKAAPAMAR